MRHGVLKTPREGWRVTACIIRAERIARSVRDSFKTDLGRERLLKRLTNV